MACINVVMVNNAAVTNHVVAATGIWRSNHVELGKGIGLDTFWRTKRNMRTIKMQVLGNSGNSDGKLRQDSEILHTLAKVEDDEFDFLYTDKFQVHDNYNFVIVSFDIKVYQ